MPRSTPSCPSSRTTATCTATADPHPLGEAEGAFILCGLLVSLAFLQRGELTASARWFERTRAACGPPALLSEEYDVRQRQLRGNLPQAFVDAELLECALAQARGRY